MLLWLIAYIPTSQLQSRMQSKFQNHKTIYAITRFRVSFLCAFNRFKTKKTRGQNEMIAVQTLWSKPRRFLFIKLISKLSTLDNCRGFSANRENKWIKIHINVISLPPASSKSEIYARPTTRTSSCRLFCAIAPPGGGHWQCTHTIPNYTWTLPS